MDKLKQIQNVELEILDEIMRLCKKHHIHFAMMGGTCLGAVRHHGMIPWDDDIDLGMLRADYERFIKICESELDSKYFFQHFGTEEKCAFIFGKVRKNDTEMKEAYSSDVKMHHGIWVDVFPFDYVNDDIHVFQKEYNKVLFLRNLLIVKQGFKLKESMSFMVKVLYYLVKLFIWFVPKSYLIKKLIQLMTKYNEVETSTLFPYGCAWKEKELISKADFQEVIYMEFNGRMVPVFKQYDKYLTKLYGDYMTPPPTEKQNSGHNLSNVKI